MRNPLSFIGDKLADIKADIILRVRILARLEEVDISLSRLKDLDHDNADLYERMQKMMSEERK